MGFLRRRKTQQQDRLDVLVTEGQERLAEAKRVQERLEPKIRYQTERHRTNAVFEEALYVLSSARRAQ